MSDTQQQDVAKRYVEAGKIAQDEARKEGTPDYDPRAHQRAVELERKLARELSLEDG